MSKTEKRRMVLCYANAAASSRESRLQRVGPDGDAKKKKARWSRYDIANAVAPKFS